MGACNFPVPQEEDMKKDIGLRIFVSPDDIVAGLIYEYDREEVLDFIKKIDLLMGSYDFTNNLKTYFVGEIEKEDLYDDNKIGELGYHHIIEDELVEETKVFPISLGSKQEKLYDDITQILIDYKFNEKNPDTKTVNYVMNILRLFNDFIKKADHD